MIVFIIEVILYGLILASCGISIGLISTAVIIHDNERIKAFKIISIATTLIFYTLMLFHTFSGPEKIIFLDNFHWTYSI